MKFRGASDKVNDLLSHSDRIIGISKFIIGFCAACAFAYGFLSAIALPLKGKSLHVNFSSIAFWFNKNLFYVLTVGVIVVFILLAIRFIGSHVSERQTIKVGQETATLGINGQNKTDNTYIKASNSKEMGWKIIIGGLLVAVSGPCLALLYRYSSGDLFVNWQMISIASLILIFGGLILVKGFKEYLK